VQVSVPDSITAAPGQTFQVPVSLGAVSGVLGYNFELSYSTQFEYVGVRSGPLTASWASPVVNAVAGRCNVAGYGVNPVSGPGVLVILTFRVSPSAPIGMVGSMSFRTAELNDGAISVTTHNGTVFVAEIALLLLPDHVMVQPGAEFTVPVQLIDAEAVLGFLFELTYDAGVLELLELLPSTPPPGWGVPTVNTQNLGHIIVGGWGTQALTGSVTLLQLRFRVHSGTLLGTETYLDFQNAELNDGGLPVVTGSTRVDITDANPLPLGHAAAFLTALLIMVAAQGGFRRLRKR
jgi:hypothetical protein